MQQEPMLFNYSLKENILYGRLDASNEEIYNAAKLANALEFITAGSGEGGADLRQAISDDPKELLDAWKLNQEKMHKLLDES